MYHFSYTEKNQNKKKNRSLESLYYSKDQPDKAFSIQSKCFSMIWNHNTRILVEAGMKNRNYPNAGPSKAVNQTEVKPRSRVF